MNMHNLHFANGFSMSLGCEDPSRDNSMSLDSSCRMSLEVYCPILPHAQLAIKHLLAATKAFSRPEILGMHQAGQVPGQIPLTQNPELGSYSGLKVVVVKNNKNRGVNSNLWLTHHWPKAPIKQHKL